MAAAWMRLVPPAASTQQSSRLDLSSTMAPPFGLHPDTDPTFRSNTGKIVEQKHRINTERHNNTNKR